MGTKPLTISADAARGAAWLARQVDRALADAELSPPQYRLLSLLEAGGATATITAERLAVSAPSVTAIVDGLVARGYVKRGNVEGDRRRVELQITDEGVAALARGDDAVAARLAWVAQHGPQDSEPGAEREDLGWWYQAIRSEYTTRLGE